MASFTNAAEGLAPSYVVDPGKSRFQVRASASGMLSAFGHNPTIAIRSFTGEAWFRPQAPEQSSLRLEIDAGLARRDRRRRARRTASEMERAMRDEVLETARYPRSALRAPASKPARSPRACIAMKIPAS